MVFDALRAAVLDLKDRQLAILPLIPPGALLYLLLEDPLSVLSKDQRRSSPDDRWYRSNASKKAPPVGAQLYAYLLVSLMGYYATSKLIPHIKQYTLKKGISGKDLGKKGTATEDKDIPEALGIVPGAVFLVCLIFCLVGYATHHPTKLLDVNSALLSICFMLFLGFTDDVLDWPWRYKLFLPSVASLPLLCCYNGSTSIVVPLQLRKMIWKPGLGATGLGHFLGLFVIVDRRADGALLDLRYVYLLYMGMLAVFCTNAINIYAGINGLEAGQSYVIACAVLIHNFIEIRAKRMVQNHLFAAMLMMSFVGVTLALTKHNWYPATVFVGDTFCYFAGMTFAVVGILGHFSKTLLLFFIPQIFNFLYSLPQLLRYVPCPRHRIPKFNAGTGLMEPSTFECGKDDLQWLKRKKDDTVCPNMTLINLTLQAFGPMSERDLCVTLLLMQVVSCAWAFYCRYYLSQFFFDSK